MVTMYLAGIGTTLATLGWLVLYAGICAYQDDLDAGWWQP